MNAPKTPEDFIQAYLEATKTHEWDKVEPLIHPNAVVTFSTGEVNEGRDAVRHAFERNFRIIQDEVYEMTKIHWVLKNEHLAVFTFHFKWKGKMYGEYAGGSGIGTSVLVHEGNHWVLLTEHLGKPPSA